MQNGTGVILENSLALSDEVKHKSTIGHRIHSLVLGLEKCKFMFKPKSTHCAELYS
jgi:hypothetical protein